MEHLQQFDANYIIVHTNKLLVIVHGCYRLRKPLIAFLALLQFFKIAVRPVHSLQDSGNKFTSNLEHLKEFVANGVIVHPYKLLTIVHNCYTLRKPQIAIIALLQFFKILVRPVHLLLDSGHKFTSNVEHLQQFDAKGIIVYPYKLLIIVRDCYTLR